MCSANAASTGDSVPSARAGTSSRPSSSMNRAPWWPSSPGWNMNSTRPASSSRRVASSWAAPDEHRRVRVVAAGVHAPVDVRCEVEAGVLRHRQRVHVAAQQDRRARGSSPSSSATMPLVDLVRGDRRRQAFERASTCSRVIGRSLPSSGHSCSLRRRAIASSSSPAACSRTDSTIGSCSWRTVLIGWLPWLAAVSPM